MDASSSLFIKREKFWNYINTSRIDILKFKFRGLMDPTISWKEAR